MQWNEICLDMIRGWVHKDRLADQGRVVQELAFRATALEALYAQTGITLKELGMDDAIPPDSGASGAAVGEGSSELQLSADGGAFGARVGG